MVAIPFPQNTAPGNKPQDGAGRLINAYVEPRPNGQGLVWRRAPGAEWFTGTSGGRAALTGTGTAAFVGAWAGGINGGVLAATGTGTVAFVGST